MGDGFRPQQPSEAGRRRDRAADRFRAEKSEPERRRLCRLRGGEGGGELGFRAVRRDDFAGGNRRGSYPSPDILDVDYEKTV